MFCSHCGKEVTVGAKFCPNCGTAIENQSAPTEGQPKAPAVEQPGNPIKKPIAGNSQSGKGKKGMPKPLIIVAAVISLIQTPMRTKRNQLKVKYSHLKLRHLKVQKNLIGNTILMILREQVLLLCI